MSDNLRGALFMMAAMFTFLVNDGLMKSMSDAIPPMQAVGLRSLLVAITIWPLLRLGGFKLSGFSKRDRRLIFLRSLAEAGSSSLYISALFLMPIGSATAILQVLPLTIALAGALFLRQPIGWRRLTAIMVGFVGVMLIIRPSSEGLNAGAILVLISVVLVTARELMTRALSSDVPSFSVTFFTGLGGAAVCFALAPWSDWRVPDLWTLSKLGMTTFMVLIAYNLNVMAMRTGDLATVNSFRYSSILFAMVIGFAVFGEIPEVLTLIGAALVVATGSFTLWREKRVKSPEEVPLAG